MDIRSLTTKKKMIIVIIVALFVIGSIATVLIVFTAKPNSNPVATKVEPGQTITKDELDKEDSSGNQPSAPQSAAPTPQTSVAPTQDQFYDQIAQSGGVAASDNGTVNFGIINTKNPIPGWYIVTIKKDSLEPAKVIFRQTNDPNNPLTIVAGPGTYFPDSIAIPDAVRRAL